jgi:hypothetical protein
VVFRVRRWSQVGAESEGRMSVEGKRKKDERSVRMPRTYDGWGVRNARAPVMQRNVKTKPLLMVIMPGWLSQSDRFNPVFNRNTITRIRILEPLSVDGDGHKIQADPVIRRFPSGFTIELESSIFRFRVSQTLARNFIFHRTIRTSLLIYNTTVPLQYALPFRSCVSTPCCDRTPASCSCTVGRLPQWGW